MGDAPNRVGLRVGHTEQHIPLPRSLRGWWGCHTGCPSHSHHRGHTRETRGGSRPWPGRSSRRVRGSTHRYAGDMVSPHVICTKKNVKPRRTVDFQALNKHAVRKTHHTQSPFHQARSIPNGKRKTVFDAWNGYHSVPLHEDDRHKTTSITPWGRYRYISTQQGYIPSWEGYTRRDRCRHWRQDQVRGRHAAMVRYDRGELLPGGPMGGYMWPEWIRTSTQISSSSVYPQWTLQASRSPWPCSRYPEAIPDIPQPRNKTDVRSWFGLGNQVTFAFRMAERMHPFQKLLKTWRTLHVVTGVRGHIPWVEGRDRSRNRARCPHLWQDEACVHRYQACAQMHLQVQMQMRHLHLHLIALWWMHLHLHSHLIHPHLHLIQMHLIESNAKQMRIKCHCITAVP